MKRTWKKVLAFVCAFTLVAVPVTYNIVNADGSDSASIARFLGASDASSSSAAAENAATEEEYFEDASTGTDYTLTIPATLNVANAGWNATDGITAKVSGDGDFDSSKKLTVTASSGDEFALVSGENKVTYSMAAAENGDENTVWEFSATELNETDGTTKGMGIIVEDYSAKPAGNYQDIVTFKANVVDAPISNIVDLSSATIYGEGNTYTATDGQILINEAPNGKNVEIVDGASVTLRGANITQVQSNAIKCLGDAEIILDEDSSNAVKSTDNNKSAIFVPAGKTITINGVGSLNVDGGTSAAGIGSDYEGTCGNIVIENGKINVQGATGIGSGMNGSCGFITINGGNITAIGNDRGPGIGGGYGFYGGKGCGDITITGGTVSASSDYLSAGIGSGYKGHCGNITIANTVTKVTATKGSSATNSIGAGYNGTCGTVTIGGVEGAITDSTYSYPSTT